MRLLLASWTDALPLAAIDPEWERCRADGSNGHLIIAWTITVALVALFVVAVAQGWIQFAAEARGW